VCKIHSVFYLSFFLFFIPAIAWAQNPGYITADSFEETAGRGLVIRSNPAGARVFVNGVERGVTPITFSSLAPGEYNIRLVRENYLDRNFDITLFAASRLTASIKMEQPQGQVRLSILRSESSSALPQFNPQVSVSSFGYIKLDDNYKADFNLPAGFYTFSVQAFGWEEAAAAVLVTEGVVPVDIIMNPAEFKIDNLTQNRKSFNPMSSGFLSTVNYRFHVSASGSALISIQDKDGKTVFTKTMDNFDAMIQHFEWNGKDNFGNHLPEGVYTVLINAGDTQLKIETEINYSLNKYPASLNNGVSGLAFTPFPYVLPAGSFQIETNTVYGDFGFFTGFPFTFGVRFSPVKKLETTAVFNINPQNNDTGWGLSGSVKYNLVNNENIKLPFSFSAIISYSYAGDNGENPLGAGKGIGIYLPVSCILTSGSLVSNILFFSPGLFWHGPDELTPILLLSAGYLLQYKDIYIGLSARAEFDLKDNGKPRFLAGTETRIFPMPSGLYFSLQAGMWMQNSNFGGFAGLGIGVVY
jgi:hypothetical protein